MREPSLGKEITAEELARILHFGGNRDVRRKKAIRWMKRIGVGMQHNPGSYWFTTLHKLRQIETADHVWQEAIRRGYAEVLKMGEGWTMAPTNR